jgi:ribosome recycling factor
VDTPAKTYELLARLDERTKSIQQDMVMIRTEITSVKSDIKEKISKLEEDVLENREVVNIRHDEIQESYDKFKKAIDADFVRKESFIPVQRVVYGIVSLILTVVFTGLMGVVILKP